MTTLDDYGVTVDTSEPIGSKRRDVKGQRSPRNQIADNLRGDRAERQAEMTMTETKENVAEHR